MDGSSDSKASLDKEGAELLCKKLGQAVVGCVRAASTLPVGRDYEYYKSFPQFREIVASSKAGRSVDRRLISNVDKLITHLAPNAVRSSMATASTLDAEVSSFSHQHALLIHLWSLRIAPALCTLHFLCCVQCMECIAFLYACWNCPFISTCRIPWDIAAERAPMYTLWQDIFEKVVDFADDRMEKVDFLIDEHLGRYVAALLQNSMLFCHSFLVLETERRNCVYDGFDQGVDGQGWNCG
jgi:hypothetical protein